MDDEGLGEQASRVAEALHADGLSRQAVFAYASQAVVEVCDEFLVADDEDHVAAGVGVCAELAARARADDDLAVLGDGVCAADDVVGRGAEFAHLAVLGLAVHCTQPRSD